MLTVKHVIWGGDFETLYQAKEVRAKYPERMSSDAPQGEAEFVAFDLPNGGVHKIEFGKVYVMNEAGRTVGKYDVGATQQRASANAVNAPGNFAATLANNQSVTGVPTFTTPAA